MIKMIALPLFLMVQQMHLDELAPADHLTNETFDTLNRCLTLACQYSSDHILASADHSSSMVSEGYETR